MKTTLRRSYDVAGDQAGCAPGRHILRGRPDPAVRIDALLTSCSPRLSVFNFAVCTMPN